MSARTLKQALRKLLSAPDPAEARRRVLKWPHRKTISPLISFLYAGDDIIKWRAVTLLGRVVADLAETDMEAARVVMRP